MPRIAVVTGANKGIGFAVVKLLLQQQPQWTVYLTARDVTRGEQAVKELKASGLNPVFHQLDISSPESLKTFRDYLKKEHGGLDVLVNNAGIAYKVDSTAPFGEQARVTNDVNYFATLNVCKELFPLLRDHSRVVNVSSRSGHRAYASLSPMLKDAFRNCTSIEQVDQLIETFIKFAKEGKHEQNGWPNSAYGTSKLDFTVASYIQQRMLDSDSTRKDIIVNACCPGYVNTDMSSHLGPLTSDQGADTLVYLATLPENCNSPRGRFVNERTVNDLF